MLRFNEGAEFKGRKGMHPTYNHPIDPLCFAKMESFFNVFYVYMHVFIFVCIYIYRLYTYICVITVITPKNEGHVVFLYPHGNDHMYFSLKVCLSR